MKKLLLALLLMGGISKVQAVPFFTTIYNSHTGQPDFVNFASTSGFASIYGTTGTWTATQIMQVGNEWIFNGVYSGQKTMLLASSTYQFDLVNEVTDGKIRILADEDNGIIELRAINTYLTDGDLNFWPAGVIVSPQAPYYGLGYRDTGQSLYLYSQGGGIFLDSDQTTIREALGFSTGFGNPIGFNFEAGDGTLEAYGAVGGVTKANLLFDFTRSTAVYFTGNAGTPNFVFSSFNVKSDTFTVLKALYGTDASSGAISQVLTNTAGGPKWQTASASGISMLSTVSPGATTFIFNQNSLQSGSTAYPENLYTSSFTVFNKTPALFNPGTSKIELLASNTSSSASSEIRFIPTSAGMGGGTLRSFDLSRSSVTSIKINAGDPSSGQVTFGYSDLLVNRTPITFNLAANLASFSSSATFTASTLFTGISTFTVGADISGQHTRNFFGGNTTSPLFIRPDIDMADGVTSFNILTFGSDQVFSYNGLPFSIYWDNPGQALSIGRDELGGLINVDGSNFSNVNAATLGGAALGTLGFSVPALTGNNNWSGTNNYTANEWITHSSTAAFEVGLSSQPIFQVNTVSQSLGIGTFPTATSLFSLGDVINKTNIFNVNRTVASRVLTNELAWTVSPTWTGAATGILSPIRWGNLLVSDSRNVNSGTSDAGTGIRLNYTHTGSWQTSTVTNETLIGLDFVLTEGGSYNTAGNVVATASTLKGSGTWSPVCNVGAGNLLDYSYIGNLQQMTTIAPTITTGNLRMKYRAFADFTGGSTTGQTMGVSFYSATPNWDKRFAFMNDSSADNFLGGNGAWQFVGATETLSGMSLSLIGRSGFINDGNDLKIKGNLIVSSGAIVIDSNFSSTYTATLSGGVSITTATISSTATFQDDIFISSGTNKSSGFAVLASGVVTINDTRILADSIIVPIDYGSSSAVNIGSLYISTQSVGACKISSTNALDSSNVKYFILQTSP